VFSHNRQREKEEKMFKRNVLWVTLTLFFVGTLVLGCGGEEGPAEPPSSEEGGSGSEGFPAKDPAQPFAIDEKGTVTLTNDQTYEIQMQRDSGEPIFAFTIKKNGVIDPEVDFAIQAIQVDMPEDLASDYVPVGQYAFEMHAARESGYGFALRPELRIFFTDQEIEAAKQKGASLAPLKGNLLVLYKEQRAPKWVPQTSISVDEAAKAVTLSNVAGAGAWWLVARKGE
jgi:hypothetical protein